MLAYKITSIHPRLVFEIIDKDDYILFYNSFQILIQIFNNKENNLILYNDCKHYIDYYNENFKIKKN
jgi:hypothetical protein